MDEDIYGPSVPHFECKTVHYNIQHVEPIIVPNFPKFILDRYKKVALLCDLMYIKSIGLLNAISQHIMFSTGSMIKNRIK